MHPETIYVLLTALVVIAISAGLGWINRKKDGGDFNIAWLLLIVGGIFAPMITMWLLGAGGLGWGITIGAASGLLSFLAYPSGGLVIEDGRNIFAIPVYMAAGLVLILGSFLVIALLTAFAFVVFGGVLALAYVWIEMEFIVFLVVLVLGIPFVYRRSLFRRPLLTIRALLSRGFRKEIRKTMKEVSKDREKFFNELVLQAAATVGDSGPDFL